MLSDEEKKDLDNIKESPTYREVILLRVIEKQSKKIEELRKKNEPQPDCAEPIERAEEMVNIKWINHNYISKDKIKEKIKELKKKGDYRDIYNPTGRVHFMKEATDYQIGVLEELLEE